MVQSKSFSHNQYNQKYQTVNLDYIELTLSTLKHLTQKCLTKLFRREYRYKFHLRIHKKIRKNYDLHSENTILLIQ